MAKPQSTPAKPKAPKGKPAGAGKALPKKPVQKAPASVKAPKEPKKPHGRPSTYHPDVAEAICARIANGEPLRQICRDENMPAWRTVYDWQTAHKDFAARIAHARELGEEAIAQECLEIADETRFDTIATKDGERPNTEWISRSKLRIETRLKLLAKWNPRKWGERVDLNHGGQKDNPIQALLTKVAGTALPIARHANDEDEDE